MIKHLEIFTHSYGNSLVALPEPPSAVLETRDYSVYFIALGVTVLSLVALALWMKFGRCPVGDRVSECIAVHLHPQLGRQVDASPPGKILCQF